MLVALILIPFQSTPSVKRATLLWFFVFDDDDISIHTLCEEGDDGEFPADVKKGVISIHTLCEEGDMTVTN